jgi:hypothetical protein
VGLEGVAMIVGGYYEAGQGNGLGQLVQEIVGGGALQSGVTTQLVAQLQDPEVKAQVRRAARPLMLEAAAYIFGAVALALILFRR